MTHGLTEEQELMRKAIREFVDTEVFPRTKEIDQKDEFPYDLVKRMAELNLPAIIIPEEYGGLGLGLTTFCLALEEISRASQTLAIILDASTTLCFLPILHMGTEEQKQKYLPRAAKGELIGAFAITEPSGATNLPAHTANAVKNGSDWILNGAKIFCTNSEAADVYIFCARVDDNVMPTTFIVERGTPGFTFGKKEEKLGWHGSNTGTIYLKDVRVSDDQRLGGLHQGLAGSYIAINESCVGIGAMCVGSAKGVFKKTLEYVKNRELWGKLLIDVQGVYDSIARMGMDIEVSSAFVYKTAAMIDAGQLPLPKTPMSFYTDACKVNPPEMAVSVCDMAIQLHGGNGYMNDLDIHRYWRDVRACLIGEGPTYRHLESMSIVLKNNNIF